MGLYKDFIAQTRKPEGFLGNWGMSHLEGIAASNIAELGCGGGRNAGELLKKYPRAKLTALDYSPVSVEKAKEVNRDMIAAGRCSVVQGSVADLPFEAESFDLATAFETVYFWPGLEACFGQVFRVLKPGGAFLICNESDGRDETSRKYEKLIDGMKCYTAEDLTAALKAAGFREVSCDRHPEKPWLAVLAGK